MFGKIEASKRKSHLTLSNNFCVFTCPMSLASQWITIKLGGFSNWANHLSLQARSTNRNPHSPATKCRSLLSGVLSPVPLACLRLQFLHFLQWRIPLSRLNILALEWVQHPSHQGLLGLRFHEVSLVPSSAELLCLRGRCSHVAGFFSSLPLILWPLCPLSLTFFDLWHVRSKNIPIILILNFKFNY